MIKLRNDIFIGEQISQNDINSWKQGDIITLEAGTGMGKSHFIKNNLYSKAVVEGKRILFLVHRTNCYDQFANDIKGKEDTIKLMTYQTIDTICKSGEKFNFSSYHYIVSDEFHYFTADSGFNNKTDLSLEAILNATDKVRIFMSATADLITLYFENWRKLKLISYKADLDFSFVDNLYFYETDDTEESILDDIVESGEKAIVFVNLLARLEELYLKYKDVSLFNCAKGTKQYKHVDGNKISQMLYDEKFEEQLIFATSVMDTGVSIKDKQVKHIICNNILDVNVLIQAIGRKRMMDKDDKFNIYIKNIDNRKLNGHIKEENGRLSRVNYFEMNGEGAYTNKYGREVDDKSILYDKTDEAGNRTVKRNDMPYFKTLQDRVNYTKMLDQGYKQYISNLFDIQYKTIDVIIHNKNLKEFLDSIVGIEIDSEKNKDLLINKIDYRFNGVQYKSYKKLNEGLSNENLPFVIIPKKSGNRRFWIVEKFEQ